MYERIKEIAKGITTKGKHFRRLSVCLFTMYSFSKMHYTNNLPSYSGDPRFLKRRSHNIAMCQDSNKPVNSITEKQTSNDEEADRQSYDYEFNIILLGATGSGKSSAGNILLKKHDAFKTSWYAKSETKTSELKYIVRKLGTTKYKINIVDTPAALDTGLTDQEVKDGMKLLEDKEIHAYVLCIPATAMTNYYIDDIKHYEKIFGDGFYELVIAAFTRYDQFAPDISNEPDKKIKFESELSHAIKQHSTLGEMDNIKSNHICISYEATEGENDELKSVIDIILKKQNTKTKRGSWCILS